MMSDRHLLTLSVLVRSMATSMLAITIPIYFSKLHLTPTAIGEIVSAGLAGAALVSFIVTFWGDRIGRRRILTLITLSTALGCVMMVLTQSLSLMVFLAFVSMFNGMGRDRGAALILEQAMLPSTVSEADRTRLFAFYNIVQDLGHAVGSLLAGLPFLMREFGGMSDVASLRWSAFGYAALMFMALGFYSRLSQRVELPSEQRRITVSPSSRNVLWKISSLFAIDSLAGGFLSASLLSYFFHKKFGVEAHEIGGLFFLARLLNALSHYGAAWLAKRIGLVNTMVFTHIPSSFLLMTVPFAPSFWIAALLFLLREGLVEMDVPTRQSYVMAVVRPEERTFASGVTHIVRMGGWAVAPVVAGSLMTAVSLSLPLLICGSMKIGYDILLYLVFRGLKPPEERSRSA